MNYVETVEVDPEYLRNAEDGLAMATTLLARVYSGENTALFRAEIEQYLMAQNALPI